MATPSNDRTAERLVTTLVSVFFLAFGWLTLLQGGVALKGKSGAVSYVTGNVSLGVAGGAFFFAALTGALLVKSLNLGRGWYAAMAAAIALPPLAFIFG